MLQHRVLELKVVYELLVLVGQLGLDNALFHQVIELVGANPAFELLVQNAELRDFGALVRLCLLNIRKEVLADRFVILLDRLEDQQGRNSHENFSIALLELLREGGVLVRGRLHHLRKVEQLAQLSVVHEVGEALRPRVFELNEDVHELHVVLELGIHNLNVLLVLSQQKLEVSERFLDPLS